MTTFIKKVIMAGKKKEFYTLKILKIKKSYYNSLLEKQRRHFLGLEYFQLGKGSQRYLARVFECSRDTVKKGKDEVSASGFNPNYSYQRKKRGGAKKKKKPLTS